MALQQSISPIQQQILKVRTNIYDPNVKKIEIVDSMPQDGNPNFAYTKNMDGNYWRWAGNDWEKIETQFEDETIGGFLADGKDIISASIIAIDYLLIRIDPTEYLHSGNAGGQSLAFASLAEIVEFYKALKQTLKDRAAMQSGFTTGTYFQTPKYAVGGVMESDE